MVWIKFGLIIAVIFICIFIAKILVRKIFNIEKAKKEFFTYNYINELHRKVDKSYRLFSTVILFIAIIVIFTYFERFYYLVFVAVFISIFLEFLMRAFFEWKYSKYPKESILTLTELFIFLLATILVLQFDLLF